MPLSLERSHFHAQFNNATPMHLLLLLLQSNRGCVCMLCLCSQLIPDLLSTRFNPQNLSVPQRDRLSPLHEPRHTSAALKRLWNTPSPKCISSVIHRTICTSNPCSSTNGDLAVREAVPLLPKTGPSYTCYFTPHHPPASIGIHYGVLSMQGYNEGCWSVGGGACDSHASISTVLCSPN